MFERLIFNKDFISSLCSLCSTAKTSCDYACTSKLRVELRLVLTSVGEKFFLDMIPHACVNDIYRLIVGGEGIARIYAECPDASKSLIEKYVKSPEEIMNIIVKCPEEKVRQYASKIILSAFLCVVGIENSIGKEVDSLSIQFFSQIIGLIGYDLAAQWTKFKQYFELLKDIVFQGGDRFIQKSFEKELIVTLLDFFLEKQSPLYNPNIKHYEMGNQAQSPEFNTLIELVVFLIRHAKYPSKNMEEIQPANSYILSEKALKCIQAEAFITKLLHFGGKIDLISKLLADLCKENKKISKRTCKYLIRVINDFDITKIPLYLDLLGELLMITDSYQILRIEWLLGYQQPKDMIQFGLASIYDIGSDINTYVSPIGLALRDDPLMLQLWRHRKKDEKLTMQCIKLIFNLVSKNEMLYNFIKNIPAPCYLFERYTDWIPGFLSSYEHGGIFLTSFEKKERGILAGETKQIFNAYSKRLQDEKLPAPQKYMIGKSVNSKKLTELQQDIQELTLVCTEIETEIYDSIPTGEQNTGLDSSYLVE